MMMPPKPPGDGGERGRSAPPARSAASDFLRGYADYLRILHRRRRAAIAAFAIVALPALLLTFTADSVFEATARVRVGVPLPEVGDQPRQATRPGINDYIGMFRTRTVARHALAELDLAHLPFARAGNPLAALTRWAGGLWPREATASEVADSPVAPSSESDAERASIDALLANLTVTPVAESRLLDVGVTATDPVAAANMANAIVRQAIRQEVNLRLTTTGDASQFFDEQLEEQRRRLEESEAALQAYKEQQNAVSVGDRQNIVTQKLADLNAALTRAKTERIAKQTLYERARALRTNPAALDTLPGAAGSTYVRQLKDELAAHQRKRAELSEQYGELHPEMVTATRAVEEAGTRLDQELAKIADAVHNEFLAAVAQERSLTQALETQKRETLDLGRMSMEYAALEREAASHRELYERLLQHSKQAGLSSELKATEIAIVDTATTPRAPARPRRTLNSVAGIGGGLCAAIGFALLLEFMDRRIRTPEQIRRDLGLPYLGYVPLVRGRGGDTANPMIAGDEVDAAFREAIRRVRANLLLSTAAEGCRSLIVTSTAPKEGKTCVATNLALALAQSGLRVLLVDADMRRARVHRHLCLEPTAGLAGVLAGLATLDQVLLTMPGTSLTVLPAGPHPPNPPELLSSARYGELLKALRTRFDWIVIDTPPIMAVADAALLAREATGVLFVVGSEMIAGETVREAVDALSHGAVVLGAVLNRVDLDRQRFYYSKYYNPAYEQYYA